MKWMFTKQTTQGGETGRAKRTCGRKLRRHDRGQSLVEFVLALPILLVIVFGIIEFAAAWRNYQVITNVAREGARLAVTPSGIHSLVDARVKSLITQSGLNLADANITYSNTCIPNPGAITCSGPGSAGFSDTVQIDYTHRFVVLGPVLDLMCIGCGTNYTTIVLSTQSTMRNE